jgi:xylulokinase
MKSEKLLVGIDLGTSSVKVGAFSLSGKARFLSSEPFRKDNLEPEAWWIALCQGLRAMALAVGQASIISICVGGQGPTLVSIDQNGHALGSAISWSDHWAECYADELAIRMAKPRSSVGMFLLRAYWLYKKDPCRFGGTYKFMQAWDFLTYKLTGELSGSELPWSHPWLQADLDLIGFPQEKFTNIQDWGTMVGKVSKIAAEVTGLPAGIPVIGGMGDATLSILGSPGLEVGWVHNEGGSSGGISVLSNLSVEGEGILSAPFVLPGWWMVGGPTSAGGRTVQWFLHELLGSGEDYTALIQAALSKSKHPSHITFLPYLDGERTPVWDRSARGAFTGLSLVDGREELINAVIEGITLGLKDILERINFAVGDLIAASVYGAQAYTPAWNQLKADVFGMPIYVPSVKEATCLGAAAVAGWGAGEWPDIATASRSLSTVESIYFPKDRNQAWSEKLTGFRELYQRMRQASSSEALEQGEAVIE